MPAVILRPPLFLENLESPAIASAMLRERTLAYPLPAGLRVAWLAANDLGTFVAAVLRHPELADSTFDIGGPEALTGEELARALSRALGHPLRYASIPPDAFERGLAAQFPPDVARGIAGPYRYSAELEHTDLLGHVSQELVQRLPRPRLFAEQWAMGRNWR